MTFVGVELVGAAETPGRPTASLSSGAFAGGDVRGETFDGAVLDSGSGRRWGFVRLVLWWRFQGSVCLVGVGQGSK